MSKLKVFGVPQSRAARTLWLCAELGIDFEHIPTHFATESVHTDEYNAINPNQKIPSIQDGDFSLWESMAINFYLAKKHKSALMPTELQGEALVLQWSFWVMTEVEKPLLNVLFQRMDFSADTPENRYFKAAIKKDPEIEKLNLDLLQKPFGVLEAQLADRDYLLGDTFTLADLNVAAVMAWAALSGMDLSSWPSLADWLQRCLARQAGRP